MKESRVNEHTKGTAEAESRGQGGGWLGGGVIKQEPVNIRKHFFTNVQATETSLLSLKGHKEARGRR